MLGSRLAAIGLLACAAALTGCWRSAGQGDGECATTADCDGGQTCSPEGLCVCPPELCLGDDGQCHDGVSDSFCGPGGGACAACPEGQRCEGGGCVEVEVCSWVCDQGTHQCFDTVTDQECILDRYGCGTWGNDHVCTEGAEVCVDGVGCCAACTAGDFGCDTAQNAVTTCTDDGDGCPEWTVSQLCTDAQHCEHGRSNCVQGCTDSCDHVGELRCFEDELKICDFGPAGCLRYTLETDCAERQQVCDPEDPACVDECASVNDCAIDEACVDGFCVTDEECHVNGCETLDAWSCTDEGTGRQQCGLFDGRRCLTWGGDEDCDSGEECVGDPGFGECVCSDPCHVGDVMCVGRTPSICTYHGIECPTWEPGTECPSDQICQGGSVGDVIGCVCEEPCDVLTNTCAGNTWTGCVPTENGCRDYEGSAACADVNSTHCVALGCASCENNAEGDAVVDLCVGPDPAGSCLRHEPIDCDTAAGPGERLVCALSCDLTTCEDVGAGCLVAGALRCQRETNVLEQCSLDTGDSGSLCLRYLEVGDCDDVAGDPFLGALCVMADCPP